MHEEVRGKWTFYSVDAAAARRALDAFAELMRAIARGRLECRGDSPSRVDWYRPRLLARAHKRTGGWTVATARV